MGIYIRMVWRLMRHWSHLETLMRWRTGRDISKGSLTLILEWCGWFWLLHQLWYSDSLQGASWRRMAEIALILRSAIKELKTFKWVEKKFWASNTIRQRTSNLRSAKACVCFYRMQLMTHQILFQLLLEKLKFIPLNAIRRPNHFGHRTVHNLMVFTLILKLFTWPSHNICIELCPQFWVVILRWMDNVDLSFRISVHFGSELCLNKKGISADNLTK